MFTSNRLKVVFTGACLGAMALAASAQEADEADVAELDRVSGKVLVNKGEGYIPGEDGMRLRPGFRVMTLENSSVLVKYTDGCDHALVEDEMLRVGSRSPCALTKYGQPQSATKTAAVSAAPETAAGMNLAWVPLAAAAGVAAITLADNDDDDGGFLPQSQPQPRPPLSRE
jgi:hypothetical protein